MLGELTTPPSLLLLEDETALLCPRIGVTVADVPFDLLHLHALGQIHKTNDKQIKILFEVPHLLTYHLP